MRKDLAQTGDVDPYALLGGPWRTTLPHGVDEPVDRHQLPGVEQEEGEYRPLPGATEGDPPPSHLNLERPENRVVNATAAFPLHGKESTCGQLLCQGPPARPAAGAEILE